MSLIQKLHSAKRVKFDDFFTPYEEIAETMPYYQQHFAGQTVLCNCDAPASSNFSKYFLANFEKFSLRRLLTLGYQPDGRGVLIDYPGGGAAPRARPQQRLTGTGDFRSPEAQAVLAQANLVITNPPFSLFREYVAQLLATRKKFLILGNQNAITYKEVFNWLKTDQIWLGVGDRNKSIYYEVPENYSKPHVLIAGKKHVSLRLTCWFTNLRPACRRPMLPLTRAYRSDLYPVYDNYPAINVDRLPEIPRDYFGAMGVPLTFMYRYHPRQFKILTYRRGLDGKDLTVGGRYKYFRIIIQRRGRK